MHLSNGKPSTLMCTCNIEASNDVILHEINGELTAFPIPNNSIHLLLCK